MIFSYLLNMQSHPSWVCGLKLCCRLGICYVSCVTPFVGVWIETTKHPYQQHQHPVTPFVGVWIETENRFYFLSPLEKVIFLRKRTIDCQ